MKGFNNWELSGFNLERFFVGLGGGETSCQQESVRTITSWPAASEAACLCALGSLWCASRTWLLARCSYSQAKSEEYPGMSMNWRNSVQTESYGVDSMGILKHRSMWFWHPTAWFWVLSFSFLFSFSLVISAGYVTQLAGFGFCTHSRLVRHSGCLQLQSRGMHGNGRATKCCKPQLLLPFFNAEVQEFAALSPLGKPRMWPFLHLGFLLQLEKALPKHQILVCCKCCIAGAVESCQCTTSFQSMWHKQASLPYGGKSSLNGWAVSRGCESCCWPHQAIPGSIKTYSFWPDFLQCCLFI